MPLGTKKWIYTKSVVRLERDEYGTYELFDSKDDILYIGYGKVASSLLQHFEDGENPVTGARNFSVEYTWNKEKSETRYKEEIAKYFNEHKKYPEYNPD